FGDRLLEAEINPLFVLPAGKGVRAADGLAVLGSISIREGAQHTGIRVSDAERQHAIVVLRDAVVEGRLTLEEYSDRVGSAVAARTDRDLAVLTSDLPVQRGATSRAVAPYTSAPVEHRAIFSHIVRRGPLRLGVE